MSQTPDFTQLDFDAIDFPAVGFDAWKQKVEKDTGKTLEHLVSSTMEQVDVKPLYTKDDIAGFDHLGYVAGIPPYFRGPYPSMYVTRPWTVRQYAGFSTKRAMPSTAATSRRGRWALASPSILPPTGDMTPTTKEWSGMWARPASPSTPWQIWILLRVCDFSRLVSENHRLTGKSRTRWEHPLRRHFFGQDVRLHDHKRRRNNSKNFVVDARQRRCPRLGIR
uniref:Methylmalonyl-CoA mutase n=1 Tax=Candidatus Kentrum sp. MB TaxID=2138164 RepID=A0A450XUL1_9GAMM|nr:MAG: Methylmalonyl-CoA mutase [Candidatus Kentron sp. MB]VFK35763.1 MAG: Methylmalonyl-CoA mutase [Candidatus Kentron sp. MB]VFK77357.1 MAG: Methylmalonyl-CoA mutase [Candidatus Kentron sp. MB]